jgi:hypothetical protein
MPAATHVCRQSHLVRWASCLQLLQVFSSQLHSQGTHILLKVPAGGHRQSMDMCSILHCGGTIKMRRQSCSSRIVQSTSLPGMCAHACIHGRAQRLELRINLQLPQMHTEWHHTLGI